MHPLITWAIVTDHVGKMHTRAALAAQVRQARRACRAHPAVGLAVPGSLWSASARWRPRGAAASYRPSDKLTEPGQEER